MEESSPAGGSTRGVRHIRMGNKINVVQLVPSLEPPAGGVDRFVVELCQALDKNKYAVTVCAFRSPQVPTSGQVVRTLQAAGCEVYQGAGWNERHYYPSLWKAYQQLKTFLGNRPVDIIHSHSPRLDVAGILLKCQRRVALVHTVSNPRIWPNPLLHLLVYHLAYPLFYQAEVGINQGLVDSLDRRPLARLLHRRALAINNAVNLERFQKPKIDKKAKKVALGLPPNSIVVGSVGRLSEEKGYPYFIRAARKVLAEAQAEVYFVLVGSGDQEAPLRQLCHELGVEHRVVFTGKRADVEEVLQCFNLFVSSSLWEGLPTVIIESIATGVPVIATTTGAKYLIKDGISGWLVPVGDSDALAQAVLAALRDPARAIAYSKKATAVLGEVSIRHVAAEYDTLYDRLLTKKWGRL